MASDPVDRTCFVARWVIKQALADCRRTGPLLPPGGRPSCHCACGWSGFADSASAVAFATALAVVQIAGAGRNRRRRKA
jgi:hypothetical protein